MSLYKSDKNSEGGESAIKTGLNLINFKIIIPVILLASGFPILVISSLNFLLEYQKNAFIFSLTLYSFYLVLLFSLLIIKSEKLLQTIFAGLYLFFILNLTLIFVSVIFPEIDYINLGLPSTSSLFTKFIIQLAILNGEYINYAVILGDFLISLGILTYIKSLMQFNNAYLYSLLHEPKLKIILSSALIILTAPFLVKINLVPYDYQIKYMSVKPAKITIKSYGYYKSLCYISMSIRIEDSINWKSVDATITGLDSNGEQFRRVQRFALDKFETVEIRAPIGWCEKMQLFTIESLNNFKADGLSEKNSLNRSKYFVYAIDEKYKSYISISPYLSKKK